MFVVALFPLRAPLDDAPARLAAALGRTAYEARMWLSAPIPRVVSRTAEREPAEAALQSLRRAGFEGTACNADEITPAARMIQARTPVANVDGLFANGPGSEHLAPGAIAAFVQARSSASVERTRTERVQVRTGRAGNVTVERDRTTHESAHTDVLYVFPHQGRPWLIVEPAIRYAALGVPLRPTRRENFLGVIERIRACAPAVPFHDALIDHPPPSMELIAVRDSDGPRPVSPDHMLDVAAYLVAQWLGRAVTTPFRTPGRQD